MSTVSSYFFQIVWHILVIIHWTNSTVAHYLSLFSKRLFSNINPYNSPCTFLSKLKGLKKLPSHVALLFQYDNSTNRILIGERFSDEFETNGSYLDKPVLDLQQIAKVTSWLVMGGIPVIELYDYHGILKFRYATIIKAVEQYVGSVSSEIFCQSKETIPNIIWHKIHPNQRCISWNAIESTIIQTEQSHRIVHIFFSSYEDGKPKLIDMVKEMSMDNINTTVEDEDTLIDVNMVNEYLKRKCCESLKTLDYKIEPDLLLNFGSTKSTLEFLPWHIRLTELHWLPQVKHIQLSDVLMSLIKFAKSEQRFGK